MDLGERQEGRDGMRDGFGNGMDNEGKGGGEWMDVTADLVPLPPIPVSSASGGIFVSEPGSLSQLLSQRSA